jgi:hypothetical protein
VRTCLSVSRLELLGILGFLLVYVLNESRNIDLHMRPRFVGMFAFIFVVAVAIGALWEIFEFAMDRTLGMRMQKPMLGDVSGLTDAMRDWIVDTLSALAISIPGWWYMRRGTESFMGNRIQRFIEEIHVSSSNRRNTRPSALPVLRIRLT